MGLFFLFIDVKYLLISEGLFNSNFHFQAKEFERQACGPEIKLS